jgi:hypothetical protein
VFEKCEPYGCESNDLPGKFNFQYQTTGGGGGGGKSTPSPNLLRYIDESF